VLHRRKWFCRIDVRQQPPKPPSTKDSTMNTRHFIAAILVTTFGAGAYAQEATSDAWMGVPSTASREAVKHELSQAPRIGEAYLFTAPPSSQSRQDVRAGLDASKLSGEFGVLQAEVYSFPRT